jgi:hypothetical protein
MTLSETNNMMKLELLMMTDSDKVCSEELAFKKDLTLELVAGMLLLPLVLSDTPDFILS